MKNASVLDLDCIPQRRWAAATDDRERGATARAGEWGAKRTTADLACFKCGPKGHLARTCQRKTQCSHRRSTTHQHFTCKGKERSHRQDRPSSRVSVRGLMVDCGGSHRCRQIQDIRRGVQGRDTLRGTCWRHFLRASSHCRRSHSGL